MIAYLKGAGVSLAESGIAPAQVAALAKLLATDAISSNQAHEVFEAMAQTGDDPNKIVDERGMRQVSDAGALQPIVERCWQTAPSRHSNIVTATRRSSAFWWASA